MEKVYSRSAKIMLYLFIFILSSNSQGLSLNNLDSLSDLKLNGGVVRETSSYSILESAKYTSSLNIFSYGDYIIEIIEKDNPENLVLEIKQKLETSISNINSKEVKERLPWWSKSAPEVLKSLDFSMVNGDLDNYRFGPDYQFRLLGKQGHWGKVYVLEYIGTRKNPEIVCAVKLLLTRPDREMEQAVFHKRHLDEIKSNFIILDNNIDISVKPYGILKNDEDHYLVFLEYGRNAHQVLDVQPKEQSIEALYDFILKVNKLHSAGFAHGDLKIDNMLFVNNEIKLCDWFSLCDFKEIELKKYRYIGDNLPPEAMRALYFGDNGNLLYSIVNVGGRKQFYFLHPIAADRYCLGISLLEFVAPDLYENYDKLMTKGGFNPWKPDSLDFWERHVHYIKETQAELLKRASKTDNKKLSELYKQIHQFISLDPMKREFILPKGYPSRDRFQQS